MSDLDKINEEVVETPVPDELDTLKARADLIGVTYHPSISVKKLREKIAAHLADEPEVEDEVPVKAVEAETAGQRIRRMKQDALALVRVNVICMDPKKKEWDGEILAVGNSSLGTIKKFVPFNTTDGYHIPKILFDMMDARQFQTFYTEKLKNGNSVRRGKLAKEFMLHVLPPLTQAELDNLAKVQAASGIIEG